MKLTHQFLRACLYGHPKNALNNKVMWCSTCLFCSGDYESHVQHINKQPKRGQTGLRGVEGEGEKE